MTNQKSLLKNLLRALVHEWGHKEVATALAELPLAHGRPDRQLRLGYELTKRHRGSPPPATEQVARAQLPETQKVALQQLAERFDQKQFLPSVSDAREFLIMMGKEPSAMKSRSEAFRRLLIALSELPIERLEGLANSTLHSGPSRLGPLSDAISAAAASLPRHRNS